MDSTTLRVSACDFSSCCRYCCISATFDLRFAFAPDAVFEVSSFGKALGEDSLPVPLGVENESVFDTFSGVAISDIVE